MPGWHDMTYDMETLEFNDNKAFSGRRFMTLLKSDFKINGAHYLKLAFAAIGCFVAVSVLVCIIAINDINHISNCINNTPQFEGSVDGPRDTLRATYGTTLMFLCFAITSVLLTVFGSLTFSNLANKRERITAFMIPASRSEKFALHALLYFFFGIIAIIVGTLVATLIAQLSFNAYNDKSQIFAFFKEDFAWPLTWMMLLWLIFGNALYTLGSSLWPRLSWLKTWILVNVVEWVFGILLIAGVFSDQSWAYQFGRYLGESESLTYVIIVSECLLIVACWIGSWFRYRSTQIVQLFMKK